MNVIADSMNKVIFLNSPAYRKFRDEVTERCKGSLHVNYPEMFDPFMILSMVQYLSECLCEVMAVRDTEFDEVLRISRRRGEGEWRKEEAADEKSTEKVLRSVESLRAKELEVSKPAVEEAPLDEEGLRAEVERLKVILAEKEAALAEAEQKVIRQRVLYEKARDEWDELVREADEAEVEHAELIALREFVYNHTSHDENIDLDEESRTEIIGKIKDKKVCILGGTEKWIKRMKRLLPGWSFIGVDDNSIGAVGGSGTSRLHLCLHRRVETRTVLPGDEYCEE